MSPKVIEDFTFCAMGALGALLDMLGVVPLSESVIIPVLNIDVVEITQKVVVSVLTAGFGAFAAYIAKEIGKFIINRIKRRFKK